VRLLARERLPPIARIYINRQVIASNQKTTERAPPIKARIVYSPDKPLESSARVWIECEEPLRRLVKPG
jgi:hypothetical protein